ncbi:MAG: MutS-related protein [Chitinophagales bacterium]
MPYENIKQTYQERFNRFQKQATQLSKKSNQWAIVRLIFFLVSLSLIIYCFNLYGAKIGFLALFAFIISFAVFVKQHDKLNAKQLYFANLADINQKEIKVLQYDWEGMDDGEEFFKLPHPYLNDLDIFGKASIYQYTNRAATAMGKRTLANWLTKAADKTTIESRQTAVRELKDKLDWRQDLQANAMYVEDSEQDIKAILAWLKRGFFIINSKVLKTAIYALPLTMLTVLVLYLAGFIAGIVPIIVWFVNLALIKYTNLEVTEMIGLTAKRAKQIQIYQEIVASVEEKTWQSEKMNELQSILTKGKGSAAEDIRQLAALSANLNIRTNALAYLLFNTFFLWELYYCMQLENWKEKLQNDLDKWFQVIGETEALSSLACLYHNNDDWTFPSIQNENETFSLSATAVGHPLLKAKTRICNDVEINRNEKIMLITGSNMAGKSTFLRTLGVNMVLALAGSVVCAKKMHTSVVTVYSSMRTIDSLQDSESSFYAELKRLKSIIDAVENKNEKVFFLLDEILKGTNSNDRTAGSIALIHQLLRYKGVGIVATHDLALCDLAATSNGNVENWCFEVAIKDDNMIFDYTIKEGICQSMNATLLMQKMGIRM